jgi:hypothetical protein
MVDLIHKNDMLSSLTKYMFTAENMKQGMTGLPILTPHPKKKIDTRVIAGTGTSTSTAGTSTAGTSASAAGTSAAGIGEVSLKTTKHFTPFQKDKLFWCFFIILKGYDEYEMNHSSAFSIEKQLKIETVEKLKAIKEQLKELKLKRTELEDELVNKQTITLKGLCALCLVHNVSITYVFGRKYCQISPQNSDNVVKKGIIVQNDKKEDSLKWTSNELSSTNSNTNDEFIKKIYEEYWLIENIQKPLKAPSAYTLTDLQTICQKLLIETHIQVNEKMKAKNKTLLYNEILECL